MKTAIRLYSLRTTSTGRNAELCRKLLPIATPFPSKNAFRLFMILQTTTANNSVSIAINYIFLINKMPEVFAARIFVASSADTARRLIRLLCADGALPGYDMIRIWHAYLSNSICILQIQSDSGMCMIQEKPLTKITVRNMHASCRIFVLDPISPSMHYSSGSSGNLLSAWTNRS